jgi:hypothetical protein
VTDQRKSIVEEIRRGQYEASIVATFNAYFPFYEEVLLPHLQNAGCRQNVILMDARMCGASLNTESLRPRSAGKQYSLIPIRSNGSFHPKLVLLLGKKRGLLLVGSHNLTLAGFSHNRELTNRFEFFEGDGDALAAFQTVWNFIKSWTTKTPTQLQRTLEQVGAAAPWLTSETSEIESSPVLAALPDGPSLWQQLKDQLPPKAKRITVIGPFFDLDFSFLKELSTIYPKAEFIVGIDPETVILRESARKLVPKVRFVLANSVGNGKGYLHAKALLLETDDGNETLVSGSANPSHPAWMVSANKNGNAEVVVVSRKAKQSLSKALGFRNLLKSATISDEDWKRIAHRKGPTDFQTIGAAAAIAFATDFGIEVLLSSPNTNVKPEVRLVGADGSVLTTAVVDLSNPSELQLTVSDKALLSKVVLLELDTEKNTRISAVVHHPIELAALAQSDKERSLRNALDSLETDAPLIEELIKVVERVIFESDFNISTPTGKSPDTKGVQEKVAKVQTEFSISLSDTRVQKRTTQRLLSSGDLGALLDALIYQLGIGLQVSINQSPALARSEEELIDSEDEELVKVVAVDGTKLVALCHRKIKTMLRRMLRQLENAAASDSLATKALVQLAAVLGIVHRLTRVTSDEASWLPRDETLVPREARGDFFLEASRLLYADNGVMKRALNQLQKRPFEELSLIRGLLVWLAWDCDYHVEDPVGFEDPDDVEDNIWGLSRLLPLASDLHDDREAIEKAKSAIECSAHEYDPSDYDSAWFLKFKRWADGINQLLTVKSVTAAAQRDPEPGDIVYAGKPPRLFAVAQAFHGKVKLIDLDSEDELRIFSSKFVTIAKPADS